MDVAHPPLAGALFPDQSLVFASRDFDAVRAGVARIFKPHLLRLHGTSADLQARMYHLRQGDASVNRLEYGAEVEIDPDRLDDFFLVQIPVAGHASIACGNRRFDSTPQAASLVSPTLPLHMRWHAGNAQVCVRFERHTVEQHCAAHLGHALDEPLEFEPELRLDTPAGRYFLRLVQLFAEELTAARCFDGRWSAAEQPHAAHRLRHPLANERVAEHFSAALLNALIYGQGSNISAALGRAEAAPAPHFVRRVEDYIRRHYAETLTVEKLARIAGVSTRTLFSGFRDFRQVTPMAYLKSVRLEKARAALQSGDVSNIAGVTKVALDTGFSHLGRFAEQYRFRFGELPSATARTKSVGPKR
ncbi:MAG: AraC family transcriptional regulator [Xanthobacteraceae bacterium]